MISQTVILVCFCSSLLIIPSSHGVGPEDDTPDYDYDDYDEMSEYEAMMRSKREVGWEDDYEGDYEDYDEADLEDYDDPGELDSEEIDEEEPDEDYVDGEPVSKNIADKDDEIKDEL